ncbi:MAG: sensor histidine kinase [Chloroflexota bacterium]
MRFVNSIKFRLTVWYLVVLGLLLAVLGMGVFFTLSHSLHRSLDNSLERRVEELKNNPGAFRDLQRREFTEELGEVVSLYISSGDSAVFISPSERELPHATQLVNQTLSGGSQFTTVELAESEEMRLYAAPVDVTLTSGTFPGGPNVEAVLVVGRSMANIEEALQRLQGIILFAVLVTMGLAGAGGWFLARRTLRPIEDITVTAQEIGASDLSRRIGVKSKDELGRLAGTLNNMIERLERAFTRQRQFTADASHELRTPLAAIEAESTLALQKQRTSEEYRKSLDFISQETNQMSGIIEKLLTLARADAGKEELEFEEVDVYSLLKEVATDIEMLCRKKGLEFRLNDGEENLTVYGDRTKLKDLFSNLLNNAVRYTSSGSVEVSLSREGGMIVVAVQDTGVGIPEEHIPNIFERFYRVDKARSRAEGGSGLGLAICWHIVDVHGGRIEVESEVGKGSTFRVSLPLSKSR